MRRRPGGFVITPFVRPPADGEDEAVWLARARAAASLAPLGHHTHWVSPTDARPKGDVDPSAVVRDEAEWLRANGFDARFFCGGGWYIDLQLSETLAQLGYVDCTATTFEQQYLDDSDARLQLPAPSRLRLPSGASLLELPATHSLGMLGRGLFRLRGFVHLHFHDWELVDARRAAAIEILLRVLRLRRRPLTIQQLADWVGRVQETTAWTGDTVAR